MVDLGTGDEFDLPEAALLDQTYLRLGPGDGRPGEDWWTYARHTVPGTLELLALDLPDSVVIFNDDHVERHGADMLREAGRRNLLRETADDHVEIDGVQVLTGSVHMASTALVLRDVVRRTTGEPHLPDGVLVAVPDSHRLLYHVPRDSDLPTALNAMISFTVDLYVDGPGPISPHVYWWDDGEFVQVTDIAEDDTVTVNVVGEFEDMVNRVVSPSH